MKHKEEHFVHFRVQTSYSILKSTILIEDLCKLVKDCNMNSVCIADQGNLFAALEFTIAAKVHNIYPIQGCILNILYYSQDIPYYAELLLLVKDSEGYKNLLNLIAITFTKNDRKVCNHITCEDLYKHNQGLILLSGYTDGIIGQLLIKSNYLEAIKFSKEIKSVFGNRFYFEIMRHNLENEKKIEREYLNIASELQIALIATNKVLFLYPNQHKEHDVLLCISESTVMEDQERTKVSNQCYLKTSKEMKELFVDLPEAITNTAHLVKRCYFVPEPKKVIPPIFMEESSQDNLIKQEAKAGLEKKLKTKIQHENIHDVAKQQDIKDKYFQRLNYELEIICNMNFAGYFLIVSDFVKWSKQNNITVGPGRGSGAGSVTAWSLDITNLDPIKFRLLFERFLNPERISMPDFDIDFCQEKREEVVTYVSRKYGYDKVAQIITFGKMQAKSVIKDVSRVLGVRYEIADYLSELIPFNAVSPVTLKQAINTVAELQDVHKGKAISNFQEEISVMKQVLDIGLTLEGLNRNISTHAAGIVISNEKLIDTVPIYKDINSSILVVQYSMKYCELSGLIKFDFLGLQTLTLITKIINRLVEQGISIDIDTIPYDDNKTYKMLSSGLSTGVFQFESTGIKNILKLLKPDTIDDIIALGALYRPGPMDNIKTFIDCKHGKQNINYMHDSLKNILEPTYGVIVYQEQVMEIAQQFAGYTLGEADLLRRAMGKKIKKEMESQKEKFLQGVAKNNISTDIAQHVFDQVVKFASYGFNKSHASAYGIISYQTAYLKANFPIEFFVNALNLEIHNSERINALLYEASKFGIKFLPPNINKSNNLFDIITTSQKVKDNNDIEERVIIFAFAALKNIPLSLGNHIVDIRSKIGDFKNIVEFIEQINPKLINKRILENLIKAGVFYELHQNQRILLEFVEQLINYSITYHRQLLSNQMQLLTLASSNRDILTKIEKSKQEEFTEDKLAYNEFDIVGLFIQYHPLNTVKDILIHSDLDPYLSENQLLNKQQEHINIVGIIIKKNSRMSKNGRFITILVSNLSSILEITIFNENIMKENAHLIKVKSPVVIYCNMMNSSNQTRVIAKKFILLDDYIANFDFNIKYYFNNESELLESINKLKYQKSLISKDSKINIFLKLENTFTAKIEI
uniref:DNA polymerase III subunit alpha n=1 Tax=Rickettsia endosymbiont of Cardiosporidium cionae TaxID=2777155 RepID=UPI00189487C3|nr:DNA polymerase III subunit alpha [Rickettsia endosymbiont of Cardiosporidium cionae]